MYVRMILVHALLASDVNAYMDKTMVINNNLYTTIHILASTCAPERASNICCFDVPVNLHSLST